VADIRPIRSPGSIPAAIRPAATAVTRPANRSAVTGCHAPPAFAANIARSGSRAAQSKTSSHASPPMNHHLSARGNVLQDGYQIEFSAVCCILYWT